jgi:putative colanic acid biosynthesis acetyltransferase WcaF
MLEAEDTALGKQGKEARVCPAAELRETRLSQSNRLARLVWGIVWLLMFRPSPRIFPRWRRMLLRLFGARIGPGVAVAPSCRVWAPWNLEMAEKSVMGPDVDCYSVARIFIGARAVVSQYSYLCSASHNYEDPTFPLVTAPIRIGARAWVCADVFIGPGVTVGDGAVVGARSSIFKDVESWTVVGGNPARRLKVRPRMVETN